MNSKFKTLEKFTDLKTSTHPRKISVHDRGNLRPHLLAKDGCGKE